MRKSPYEPIGLASALETEVRDMRAVLRYAQDARRKAEADLAALRGRHQRAIAAMRELMRSSCLSCGAEPGCDIDCDLCKWVAQFGVRAILDAEQDAYRG